MSSDNYILIEVFASKGTLSIGFRSTASMLFALLIKWIRV
jgi:hypothetical protein